MAASGRRTDSSLRRPAVRTRLRFRLLSGRAPARSYLRRPEAGGRRRQAAGRVRALRRAPVHGVSPQRGARHRAHPPRDPARMTVAFLGLTGTQGVLPFCYTEWMIARKAAKDDTLLPFSISSTTAWYLCSIGPGRNTARRSSTSSASPVISGPMPLRTPSST